MKKNHKAQFPTNQRIRVKIKIKNKLEGKELFLFEG
jgi:hypothetical protein